MEARANFYGAQVPAALIRLFVAALLAAFVLGGAGGYVFRALTVSLSSGANSTVTTTPFVVEQAPYSTPSPVQVSPLPTDPSGGTIPI
jgi:hypothetical protein